MDASRGVLEDLINVRRKRPSCLGPEESNAHCYREFLHHRARESCGLALEKDSSWLAKHQFGVSVDMLRFGGGDGQSLLESEDGEGSDTDSDDGEDYALAAETGGNKNIDITSLSKLEGKVGEEDTECLTQERLVNLGAESSHGPLGLMLGEGGQSSGICGSSKIDFTMENSRIPTGKSCSCTFCVKAAYMWADLYYQDACGRQSALKKSVQFARMLGERYACQDVNNKDPGEASKQPSEMEVELTQQWKTLFQHIESCLIQETGQIRSNILKLKEFKENCQNNMREFAAKKMRK